ncbi:MAG TPA: hypothetical protein DEG88_11090 [Propionibacteriaceae bacterium]|nr:hypothetical protein [Micropruina sp.]HBY23788.1 hypothetical protein [Propionibacteriaceae bacterium]
MPESAEDYYARILNAADEHGRLPVAVTEMPGWDIFPFEVESLRLKPLRPLLDAEPERRGESPQECWCAKQESLSPIVWSNERWMVTHTESGLPLMAILSPRAHHDLADLPTELAAELGQLTVALAGAIEELPSVGRTHIARWGDGGAHLHLMFLGRPRRAGQFRGSPLVDWEENLPRVPTAVADDNAAFVADRMVARVGGTALGRVDS